MTAWVENTNEELWEWIRELEKMILRVEKNNEELREWVKQLEQELKLSKDKVPNTSSNYSFATNPVLAVYDVVK